MSVINLDTTTSTVEGETLVVNITGDAVVNISGATDSFVNVQNSKGSVASLQYDEVVGFQYHGTDESPYVRISAQRLRDTRSWNMNAHSQIAALSETILSRFPGEPSKSEGAVETAIRLLNEFADAKECAQGILAALQGQPYNQTEKPRAQRSYAEPEEPLNTFHLDGYEGVLRMTLDDGAIWDQYIWRDSTTTLGQHVVLAEQEAQLKGRRIVELSLRPPMTFTQGDEPKDARAGDIWRNTAEEYKSDLDRCIGFKTEDCADSNIGPVSAYTVDDDDTDETEDDIRVESLGDLGYILDALGGLMSPLVDAAIALAAQALQAYTEAQERERDT